MQQIELHPGPFGRLTKGDILASLAMAGIALLLTPVIGLLVLLIV
ncbi:hypothetical protein [Rhodopseudomonas pseudopalustris]|uniref:Uncharacterized protein n=2 Tax=Rhodopseudomonas TaxID=1073 RepID=Q139P3_RHOPS|nr:hypothetical protein [Rhodopseudomonas pseudopalustris]ABE39196.1 hypothetical protein RPD_1961 [Rhodopseudomonas palustris BisB5]MBB1091771.1 twin-arginine translocation pathway signal protein [Rhodopseudomonas palustris]SEO73044.1 hypothetical protein SAMN05444123_104240 [Rhodopseudomonas pseudopalustris]